MSEITFERGGETMVLKMEHITGVAKFDATPSDIAALLDQHPEIAEQAGWIRLLEAAVVGIGYADEMTDKLRWATSQIIAELKDTLAADPTDAVRRVELLECAAEKANRLVTILSKVVPSTPEEHMAWRDLRGALRALNDGSDSNPDRAHHLRELRRVSAELGLYGDEGSDE